MEEIETKLDMLIDLYMEDRKSSSPAQVPQIHQDATPRPIQLKPIIKNFDKTNLTDKPLSNINIVTESEPNTPVGKIDRSLKTTQSDQGLCTLPRRKKVTYRTLSDSASLLRHRLLNGANQGSPGEIRPPIESFRPVRERSHEGEDPEPESQDVKWTDTDTVSSDSDFNLVSSAAGSSPTENKIPLQLTTTPNSINGSRPEVLVMKNTNC